MKRLLLAIGLAATLIGTAAVPALADPPGGGAGRSWHGENDWSCNTMAYWESRGFSPEYVYVNYHAKQVANKLYYCS